MINKEQFWEIAGVEQHSQFQSYLEGIIFDTTQRDEFYTSLISLDSNCLDDDLFRDYFEEYAAERKSNQQDFTPLEVSVLMNRLIMNDNSYSFADYAAGTGSLLCQSWKLSNNKDELWFVAEELSDVTIPYLIHNLAIRNVNAFVIHGNTLSGEIKRVFKLTQTLIYSDVEDLMTFTTKPLDCVVMNPPYSAKWKPMKDDERFKEYGIAPKGRADLAFLLDGLDKLNDSGKMAVLLPSGVLFREGSEKEIRKKLVEKHLIDAIIFLPENLFESTQVPTQILIIDKSCKHDDILMIDVQHDFNKQKNKNVLKHETIDKILNTYQDRLEIDNFSRCINIEEIESKQWNLNINNYINQEQEDIKTDTTCLELLSQMQLALNMQQAAIQNIESVLGDVLIDEAEQLGLIRDEKETK